MSLNFADITRADMRLVMLRCMAEDPGYALNESTLQLAVEMFGHRVSRDQVRSEMRWLQEQGLLAVEAVSGILVAKLTGRGMDCAEGRCIVDGVKKPRPK